MRGLAGFVALLLLSGCADPLSPNKSAACGEMPRAVQGGGTISVPHDDWSKETMWLNVTAPGRFVVELPVPVSQEGTSVDDWVRNAMVPDGWEITAAASPGQVRLAGAGEGSALTCSNQPAGTGQVAEAYLQANWGSLGPRPESIPVQVDGGPLGLVVDYHAGSNYCGATAHFAARDLASGSHMAAGKAQAICS